MTLTYPLMLHERDLSCNARADLTSTHPLVPVLMLLCPMIRIMTPNESID
jgi:hypothetical protein